MILLQKYAKRRKINLWIELYKLYISFPNPSPSPAPPVYKALNVIYLFFIQWMSVGSNDVWTPSLNKMSSFEFCTIKKVMKFETTCLGYITAIFNKALKRTWLKALFDIESFFMDPPTSPPFTNGSHHLNPVIHIYFIYIYKHKPRNNLQLPNVSFWNWFRQRINQQNKQRAVQPAKLKRRILDRAWAISQSANAA